MALLWYTLVVDSHEGEVRARGLATGARRLVFRKYPHADLHRGFAGEVHLRLHDHHFAEAHWP